MIARRLRAFRLARQAVAARCRCAACCHRATYDAARHGPCTMLQLATRNAEIATACLTNGEGLSRQSPANRMPCSPLRQRQRRDAAMPRCHPVLRSSVRRPAVPCVGTARVRAVGGLRAMPRDYPARPRGVSPGGCSAPVLRTPRRVGRTDGSTGRLRAAVDRHAAILCQESAMTCHARLSLNTEDGHLTSRDRSRKGALDWEAAR